MIDYIARSDFTALDLTEGRCAGVAKILRAMKDNGSPPPEFESD